MIEAQYKSNGKFLLTGEYLVLKGALALALPLKSGQSLSVKTLETNNGIIHWNALIPQGLWFSATLDKHDFTVKTSDDFEKAEILSTIFSVIKELNPNILQEKGDYSFTTSLEFDPQWGLGSSSTLINNLSEWAGVNPYEVLKKTFGGSGYDIACAKADRPIFYHLEEGQPIIENCDFNPPFADNLYFVYQGHKQSSSKEVDKFMKHDNYDYKDDIMTISELSRSLPDIMNIKDFCTFINIHEAIIASFTGRQPIKTTFPEFKGEMKSLGAWGGDFFLAASLWNEEKVRKYFKNKGLKVVIKYKDIVK